MATTYVWDIRNPDGGSQGLDFARGTSAPTDVMLAHAMPERATVEVRDESGALVARGEGLSDEVSTPMARLVLEQGRVSRRNVWPGQEDLGRPVILPGGEVGILTAWWNAPDESSWRWSVEFSNRR